MRNRLWLRLRQDHGAHQDHPATWPAGALGHSASALRSTRCSVGGLRSMEVRGRLSAEHAWFHDLFTPSDEYERTERPLEPGDVRCRAPYEYLHGHFHRAGLTGRRQ
jgi:hypothetical protein